ncbi:hypothetical protein Hdeb2414_s0006g00201181 [Helianthus debilis subsp. tardiflorus]
MIVVLYFNRSYYLRSRVWGVFLVWVKIIKFSVTVLSLYLCSLLLFLALVSVLGNPWGPQICLDLFLLVVLLASWIETLT